MKNASFFHLSASQETSWPSQTGRKCSLEYWRALRHVWKSHWSRIYLTWRHCWGLYSFQEDILSCVAFQEKKDLQLLIFLWNFLFSSYFFWNWLYSIFGEKGTVQKRSDWARILCFRAWLKTCISPNSCVTRRQVQKAWIICTLSLWEAIFKAERRGVLTSRDKWHIVNSVRHSDTVIMSSIEMPINNTRRCPDTTAYLGK